MSQTPIWLPIESNPDVMNKFLSRVGLKDDWTVVDVIGIDDDLLAFVPQPVAALLLLFPVPEDDDNEENAFNQNENQNNENDVYFLRQTIRNACGTIALIHAVANNLDKIEFSPDSLLKSFIDSTKSLSPAERGKRLEENQKICESHELCANEGQTDAPNVEDVVNHHFIAFVENQGRLYQLDGRKSGPIDLGPTRDETFLKDAAGVCKQFMSRDPENLNFTLVALVKNAS